MKLPNEVRLLLADIGAVRFLIQKMDKKTLSDPNDDNERALLERNLKRMQTATTAALKALKG